MATLQDYEHYHESLAQRGFPATFERAYNDLRNAALRNTWQGFTGLAGTAFGKGALLAGLAFLAIPALGVGLAAALGTLSVTYGGAAVGAGTAMLGGLSIGANTLFTGGGMALVGIAGALNATRSWVRENREIAELRHDAEQRLLRRGLEAERELQNMRAPRIEAERMNAPRVEEERQHPRPEPTTRRESAAPQEQTLYTPPANDDAQPHEQTTFRDRFAQKQQASSFVAAEQQRRAASTFPPGRSDI